MALALKKGFNFARREAVLCAALLLAALSCFAVPPSAEYASYIDWDTLALLFSLMAVMKGFQDAGVFVCLAGRLLRLASTTRSMMLLLVFLPFAFSMVITNDVALITFIPFGMTVLRLAGQERLLVPMAVLQTVAANLGSMLTPMGNPQNLYLYSVSGMSAWALVRLMLPYVLLAAVCLAVLAAARGSVPVRGAAVEARLGSRREIALCLAGFALCLLGVFKALPATAVAAAIGGFLLLADRRLLARVDYSLLATFAAFFIFIGNVGAMDAFRGFLASAIEGREELAAVAASQLVSNVPAALLLSGFTSSWQDLIVGCNLGGLGTLIASMASLITYKMVSREYPERVKSYFAQFTLCNLGLLALLLGAGAVFFGQPSGL